MKHLQATTTSNDESRATRALLAWLAGDEFAFHVVMDEVMEDPTGTPGILFVVIRRLARLGTVAVPDFADQLRASLLPTEDDEGRGRE
jgi:hypothetical protein